MDMKSFLFITLNTCIGSYGPCNPPRTQKPCAITHENNHRTRKQQLFGHTTQTCIRPYGWCKSSWNTKIWSITHGNDHKKQKRRHFHHTSQICKSPWNPNTVGDYSCKRSENTKMTSFW